MDVMVHQGAFTGALVEAHVVAARNADADLLAGIHGPIKCQVAWYDLDVNDVLKVGVAFSNTEV